VHAGQSNLNRAAQEGLAELLADEHQADALLRAVKMPMLEQGAMKTAEKVGCRLRARAPLAWQRPCQPVWLCSAGAVCTLAASRPCRRGRACRRCGRHCRKRSTAGC
jgi:hypothetical protein